MSLTPQELRQELRQRALDARAKAATNAKALSDKTTADLKAQLDKRTAKTEADIKALLDAANSASQTVAVLHVTFMAVCAYVLVIVSGTTDLDLLMGGNNVKLPVIDVMVPIVGFYAVAPYLIVLMHLNLLLQLQLLSRKLFAFDNAAPSSEAVGGWRDRLHIFPYTYYLVGRPSWVVGGLLGLVVSITLIVLPLATLLELQLKFLAYQAEGITWAHRIAVFFDVGCLAALWPVILHRRDDWRTWWREALAAHLRRKWAWLAVIVLVASVALVLFAATPDLFTLGLVLGVVAPLLWIVLSGDFSWARLFLTIPTIMTLSGLFAALWGLIWASADSLPSLAQPAILIMLFLGALPLACFWRPAAPRGSLALLSALVLGPFLTLGLMVDGEDWEGVTAEAQKSFLTWRVLNRQHEGKQDKDRQDKTLVGQFESNRCASIGQTVLSCIILAEQRRLDLHEKALFAKPPNPELLAALRADDGLKNKDKLERISLMDRSLRRARMRGTLLVGVDLRQAQLQGADLILAQMQSANLSFAQLQGADLRGARLQSANLSFAQMQSANLSFAQLQGADLSFTSLQGVDLRKAQLQSADLSEAQLQGADLGRAQLQGADLVKTNLQGADLSFTNLQGADLSFTNLQGVDLSFTNLQGADLSFARLQGADLSFVRLQSADLRRAQLQGADLRKAQLQGANLSGAQLQGANLSGATLYQNGDPTQADLLDMCGTVVTPLSQKEFSEVQATLKSIRFQHQKDSLQRLDVAAEPGAKAPTFASCLTDGKSQAKCKKIYDAANVDEKREFMRRLHESLTVLACEDAYTARGVLRQIPGFDPKSDSTRAGLATVLLARMKASEPCPGLDSLSAEDKAKLERWARMEAKWKPAAKAADTSRH